MTSTLQHLKLTSFCSSRTCSLLVTWTSILLQPHQHIQVAATCCLEPTSFIPEKSIFPQPLQHLEMSSSRCQRTTLVRWEGTSILFGPLKNWKILVPPTGGQNSASPLERGQEAVRAIVCTQSEEECPPLNSRWLQRWGSFHWSLLAMRSIQL